MHNLAAIHLIWLVCGLKLLFIGHSSLAPRKLRLRLKLMMVLLLFSFTSAKTLHQHKKSQHWYASEQEKWSKLKRNIHQIYALRVAANVCVERLMLQSCCTKHTIKRQHSHFAYSTQTCVDCMANNSQALNQCRLFYLLQFSGLVIVICVRVYFAWMSSRTRIQFVQFSRWPGNIQHIRASATIGLVGFNFVALLVFFSSVVVATVILLWIFESNDVNEHVLMVRNLWKSLQRSIWIPSRTNYCAHTLCLRSNAVKNNNIQLIEHSNNIGKCTRNNKKMCNQMADRCFVMRCILVFCRSILVSPSFCSSLFVEKINAFGIGIQFAFDAAVRFYF